MSIYVAFRHKTPDQSDRLIKLGLQAMQLHPVPRSRVRMLSYSFEVSMEVNCWIKP